MRGRAACIAAMLAGLLLGGFENTATAQPSELTNEARALYDLGAVAFRDGRFDAALSRFQESYALSNRPTLLYNIATAHDRLNQYQEAIDQYEAYLVAMPDAGNANYTRSRIALLRSQLPDAPPPEDEPDEASTEPETDGATPDESVEEPEQGPPDLAVDANNAPRSNAGPIAFVAGGGAVLIAGVALALAANAQYSDLEDTCMEGACAPGTQGDIDRLRRLGVSADVLMALGGAAAVGGLVWYFAGRRGERDDAEAIRLDFGPTGVSLRGAF